MSDYTPNRKFVNVEGQDTFPIRLERERIAWLTLPKEMNEQDAELIISHLKFIAECSSRHKRNPGPPEPNGRLP